MGFDRPNGATLSLPAVAREEGEALSSWLARIARTHLLDLNHVGDEIGCRIELVDHAPSIETIARIAQRTGVAIDNVEAAVHPLSGNAGVPRHGELDWRVCSACLSLDSQAGRVPHVRTAWTHPLATVCLEHRAPLTIPTALESSALLSEEAVLPRQDHGLKSIEREPLDSLLRAAALVAHPACSGPAAELLAREVCDLVDVLAVQIVHALGRGAALGLFEQPRRNRHVSPLALNLPEALITGLDPADRLLFVRAAIALRWPSPEYRQEREVLGDWFPRVVTATVPKGRRRVIGDHAMDPLGLLAVALPAQPFHQLRRRTEKWSEDLRVRWAAAEQLAALAGLN